MRTLKRDVGLLILIAVMEVFPGAVYAFGYVAGPRVWSQCFEWELARSRNRVAVISARTRTSWR
ncbi:hypothetical protein CUJ91_31395 [Paraburkholderia graminis]|nr:hypothetical protein CUJ91_31395 [Paraburkholderia graminis]